MIYLFQQLWTTLKLQISTFWMHSSRMRTVHSSSRLSQGGLPQCMLGYHPREQTPRADPLDQAHLPPGPDTPPPQQTPLDQEPPPRLGTSPRPGTPPRADPSRPGTHPQTRHPLPRSRPPGPGTHPPTRHTPPTRQPPPRGQNDRHV